MSTGHEDFYYKPSNPGSFGGSSNLKRELKKSKRVSLWRTANDWLSGQDPYTLHKPITRKFQRRKTIVAGPGEQLQADLIDVKRYAKDNNDNRYLLTIIDVFSKKAWAIPVKTKSAIDVSQALKKVLKNVKPNRLQTDKGTEFINSEVRNVLSQTKTKHFTTENENIKASIVERWNRTLRSALHRYFTKTGKERYIDVLADLISAYNNRPHSSTGIAPDDINSTNSEDVFYQLYDPVEAFEKQTVKFRVGDYVRVSKARTAFQRGFTPNWSVEIFRVSRILPTTPVTYALRDWNGEPITGSFYDKELQRVKEPETFKIERVLQVKKIGKRRMALVKWLGYPDSFNQWIPESDITNIS